MHRRELQEQYEKLLSNFLAGDREAQLYMAQQLSKSLVTQDIAPEDIVDFHIQALEKLVQMPEPVRESFQLLLEMMMEYGNTYRQHNVLRDKQKQLESEIDLAVVMQQTMLPQVLPEFEGVEFGLISVPAKKMSGDYYNILQENDVTFSVAIADIVGKGIPAALCMSMIKYGMDAQYGLTPATRLHHLNIVVEQNIDPSMFVTMLLGNYDTARHSFRYAVAGHEPGFFYRACEQRFYDLEGRGLVLGVLRDAQYPEYELNLEVGDMIVLMTDGVSERKVGMHYLNRQELTNLIQGELAHTAQEIAENLYRRLLLMTNYELPDDHTMIVIRRTK
ncbi:PP2C family protein-serine/threonine phosphatase [Brevibacillus dissolubilis]|uniref:PP2C family protein-serine/threonine phosphatase n=1 Tax=Brevibacillus dissolubilis TaxID=1844116 RepID=UPI001115F542|nr:PP2C family protein-serine/threonine phosphatase [Brevibacillus dissolubilis]